MPEEKSIKMISQEKNLENGQNDFKQIKIKSRMNERME